MTYIDEVFAAGGILAKATPGYSPRAGQIAYAKAVDSAITRNKHLLVEGPTGTGKSYGYLIPTIRHAVAEGRRVLVVTGNIGLQEQLVTKDLPRLAEVLPWKFTYALQKGRNNFLCQMRYEEERDASPALLGAEDRETRDAIVTWGALTRDGDRNQLPCVPSEKVWRQFAVSPEDCPGTKCALHQDCFYTRHQERAEAATVLVVNYHLFLAHLQVFSKTKQELIIKGRDLVVLDEAHRAPDIARGFFGFDIRPGTISWIAHKLPTKEGSLLSAVGEAFFARLNSYRQSSRYDKRLTTPDPVEWRDLAHALENAASRLAKLSLQEEDLGEKALRRKQAEKAEEVAAQIEAAMQLEGEDLVYYIDEAGGRGALCCKPINVGTRLKELLFDRTPTVIATSATLSVGRDFGFIAEELGVDQYDKLTVASPFKWDEQALLVMPSGLPDPNDRGRSYPREAGEVIAEVALQARGRTLALFTSYAGLNAAHDVLRAKRLPYRLLKQGEAPHQQLVDEFRNDTHSILLGTDSFFEGVDIPGEALACVIIDKLPFPNSSDPVFDYLTKRDDDWFFRHSLPRAIIKLKQGVGRLIRSSEDFGAVVLLDPRFTTKGYGPQVVAALPKMVRTRNVTAIRQFLDDVYPAGGARAVP